MPDSEQYPVILLEQERKLELEDECLGVVVEESLDGIYRCELSFRAYDAAKGYLYMDRKLLDFGQELTLRLGGTEAADTLFTGKITGIEAEFVFGRDPPAVLTVLAEDALQGLRLTRRTRTFEDMTDAAIMQDIAGKYGLSADVSIEGDPHKVMVQVNQSDLAFLRERARAVGAELWIGDGKLAVKPRTDRSSGDPLTLIFGADLVEFRGLADLAGQRTSLNVTGWDVTQKAAIAQKADKAALSAELSGQKSGPELLDELGTYNEQLVHAGPVTDAEATAVAEAFFKRRARRFVTGRGMADGDVRIRVGTQVELQSLGPLFTGTYYVVETRHVYDPDAGYRTYFRVERPGIAGG